MKNLSSIAFAFLVLLLGCRQPPLDILEGTGSGGNAGGDEPGGIQGGETGGMSGAEGRPRDSTDSGGSLGAGGVQGGATGAGGVVAMGGAGGIHGGASGAGGAGGPGGAGGVGAVVPPFPGPVIHFQFDEGAAATLMDRSGNGNNGTIVQGLTGAAPVNPSPRWSSGRTGGATDKALETNGVDEWVRIPDSDSIDLTGVNDAVSISIWTYVNAFVVTKALNTFVQRQEGGTRLPHFALGMLNGAPYAQIHFFGTSGPRNVPLGAWTHLAMTYDGVTLRLYMNGDEVSFLDTGWPIQADETPIALNGNLAQNEIIYFVNGRIDEFQMYARALTPAQVRKLSGR